MAAVKKKRKKNTSKRSIKASKTLTSNIVTVRISDEEKVRIENVMTNLAITRYSDVMRMALQMMEPDMEHTQVNMP